MSRNTAKHINNTILSNNHNNSDDQAHDYDNSYNKHDETVIGPPFARNLPRIIKSQSMEDLGPVKTKGILNSEMLKLKNQALVKKLCDDEDEITIPSKVVYKKGENELVFIPGAKKIRKEYDLEKQLDKEFRNGDGNTKPQTLLHLKRSDSIDVTKNSSTLFSSVFNSYIVDKIDVDKDQKQKSTFTDILEQDLSVVKVDCLFYDSFKTNYGQTFRVQNLQHSKLQKEKEIACRNFKNIDFSTKKMKAKETLIKLANDRAKSLFNPNKIVKKTCYSLALQLKRSED